MTARPPKNYSVQLWLIWPGLNKPGFFYRVVSNLRDACPNYRSAGDPGKAKENTMFRNFKVLLFALAIVIIAGGAYAFAAANTVPDSAAGYAASAVPGYTVTDIVYDLDDTDPTLVDAITFAIAPSTGGEVAVIVKVQTATSGAWTDCTLAAGAGSSMNVTCTYGTLPLEDVTALNIVASSSLDPAP